MSFQILAKTALLASSALVTMIATPVRAADSPASAVDGATTLVAANGAVAPNANQNDGLGDIVVTATKRETNLQDTPIAISVIDSQTIKDRHVQSLLDLADGAVPSLRVATFEARQSALTVGIRGIVPFDANQTARDQGVGVYIDGVYLGRQQGLNAALFDVARIEVLRGPQGTLFGRNTEGGALSIVTAQPTGEFDGRVSSGIGNYGSHFGEAHIDLPAIAPGIGNVAIKLDAVEQHQDPTVKNPLAGQAGWNQYERVGGRIQAKWTPFDGFSALFSYDRSRDENTPNYSQLINYNPNGLPVATLAQITANGGKLPAGFIAPLSSLVVVSGGKRMRTGDIGVPQQVSVDRTQGESATLSYDLSSDIQLRSITAWRTVSTDQWDNSGGAHRTIFLPNAKFSRYSLSFLNQRQFSQEIQLIGKLPQIDYVLGGYYFNERAQEQAATPSSNQWNADGTGYTILSEIVNGPITSSNQGWQPGSQFLQRASVAYDKSYSLFGQATYTPDGFDRFHLTLGGRYSKDDRHGLLYLVQNVPTNYAFKLSNSRFDPLIVAAFDATPDVNLYVKYATGYRSGGANDRSQTFNSFGPESVKSYEIGLKTNLFDNRVRLNLAGYVMDRKGTQTDFDNVNTNPFIPGTTIPNPTFNLHTEETRNAPGISKIRGIEADLTARVSDHLTLGAAYAYTYTKVPPTPNPFIGNIPYQVYVVYTPRNAASAYADYSFPIGGNGTAIRAHLDANYASSQYSFQNEPVKSDASFVMNGRIALAEIPISSTLGTKATIALWSRNLLNTTYIYRRSDANNAVLGEYGNFNPPRTFGLEGTLTF